MSHPIFQVKSSTVEDYEVFLELIFGLGYTFSGHNTVNGVNNEFGEFKYPTVVFRNGSTKTGGNRDFQSGRGTQYTLPQDFAAVFNLIKHPENHFAVVKDVGEYQATIRQDSIQVGCQTITSEKFQEIITAVNQIRK